MFRDDVMAGKIPVCKEMSMEMNRIDALIADPRFFYDDEAVEGWIDFCNSELTLTDGSDLNLLDSFKLWGEQVFGWYYFIERSVYEPYSDGRPGGHYINKIIKKRLINKQYLIVGRGAAKTLYDTCIHAYFLTIDTSTTKQITLAPRMAQADEVLGPFRTAIARKRGPLFKFLTHGSLQNTTGSKADRAQLSSTKKGIQNFLTESILEVVPMSIDKVQGERCKIATIDEWLSGEVREDVSGAIEQGASKNDDYLILMTSSEGTVRNGPGDTVKMELMKILKGEYINPHVSIFWYKLDDIKEVGNPAMWLKANPNVGKTVTYETIQLDVERAEQTHLLEMIFWLNDLVYQWKDGHSSLHTKKPYHNLRKLNIGNYHVQWAVTYHKVMTSAHLRLCSRYQIKRLVLRPETTSRQTRWKNYQQLCVLNITNL